MWCTIDVGGVLLRVQVNLSYEMVARTDFYAKKLGVTRSSLCAFFIGQGVMAYDKSFDVLSNAGEQVVNSLVSEQIRGDK